MANMVKDKDGVVKYWVRAHEVTCNYTEYEHDVEYLSLIHISEPTRH